MGILRKVETLIRSEELEKLRDLPSAEIVRLGRLASLTEKRVKKLGLKSDSSACSFYPREKTCKDATDNSFAARLSGDGNCLYNAVSVAVNGDESLSATLRALTSAELYLNASFDASHPHFITLLATEKASGLIGRLFLAITHL